jgi:hypothetical protein
MEAYRWKMLMDNEMIERCALALKQRFKEIVAKSAGMSYEETKVIAPNMDIWLDYANTVIKAMREPTEKILGAIHGCYPNTPDKLAAHYAKVKWQEAIDAVVNDG